MEPQYRMLRAQALAELFNANLDDNVRGIFLTTPSGHLIGSSTVAASQHGDPSASTAPISQLLFKKACMLGALTWHHEFALLQQVQQAQSTPSSEASAAQNPTSNDDDQNHEAALQAATSTPLRDAQLIDSAAAQGTLGAGGNPLLPVVFRQTSSAETEISSPTAGATSQPGSGAGTGRSTLLKSLIVSIHDTKRVPSSPFPSFTSLGLGSGEASASNEAPPTVVRDCALCWVGVGLIVGALGSGTPVADLANGEQGAYGYEGGNGEGRGDGEVSQATQGEGKEGVGKGREELDKKLLAKAEAMAEYLAQELQGLTLPREMQ